MVFYANIDNKYFKHFTLFYCFYFAYFLVFDIWLFSLNSQVLLGAC